MPEQAETLPGLPRPRPSYGSGEDHAQTVLFIAPPSQPPAPALAGQMTLTVDTDDRPATEQVASLLRAGGDHVISHEDDGGEGDGPASLTHRERRARKAERLRQWADGREQKANAAHDAVDAITARIPFGQPILVGHHSERGARADQRRIERGMDAACEHSAKASEMRSRADNIEAAARHAIYSDDPDAVDRLTAKLRALEERRERVKRFNASCRSKTGPDYELLTESEQREARSLQVHAPIPGRNGAFPSFALSNLTAEIGRTRKRLDELQAPERGRAMVAKYGGECRMCGRTVERGERITYYRRSKTIECEEDCA